MGQFGCAVLLDPFWDITGSGKYKVVGRSAAFGTLVDLVVEGLPEGEFLLNEGEDTEETIKAPVMAGFQLTNQLVLIGVWKAIVGDEAVVDHVNEFVTKTKTKIRGYFDIEEESEDEGEQEREAEPEAEAEDKQGDEQEDEEEEELDEQEQGEADVDM